MDWTDSFPVIGNNDHAVVVLSGGLDSTILTYLVNDLYKNRVHTISFNYHQRHNIELECAKRTCTKLNIPHKIISIEFFGDLVSPISALSGNIVEVPNIKEVLGNPQPVTYVPYRNMLFLTLALSYAEVINSKNVFIGLQAHDLYQYWDTDVKFVDKMNAVSSLNRMHQIKIVAPFVELSKAQEIKVGQELGVPFEDTWTCYAGPNELGQACGTCPSCAERIKNFMDAGIKDPVPYAVDIPWKE